MVWECQKALVVEQVKGEVMKKATKKEENYSAAG